MSGKTHCYPGGNIIVLGRYLGKAYTCELCDHLDAINSECDVTVDGSKVCDIDASALQILAALAIQLRNNGRRLRWISPSDSLLTTASLSGLSGQLGLETP